MNDLDYITLETKNELLLSRPVPVAKYPTTMKSI
jgi:hypothetical protein